MVEEDTIIVPGDGFLVFQDLDVCTFSTQSSKGHGLRTIVTLKNGDLLKYLGKEKLHFFTEPTYLFRFKVYITDENNNIIESFTFSTKNVESILRSTEEI